MEGKTKNLESYPENLEIMSNQGSRTCAILRSRIGESGEFWEKVRESEREQEKREREKERESLSLSLALSLFLSGSLSLALFLLRARARSYIAFWARIHPDLLSLILRQIKNHQKTSEGEVHASLLL